MDQKITRTLVLAGGLALSLNAFAAGPSASMLSNTCAGCHGTDGSSVGPAPTIAGLSEGFFIESMEEYKSGNRPSTIMDRIAKGYTEEEFKMMAKFFSEKPFGRIAQTHDAKQAKKGKKIHKKYCENCHEDGGRVDDESGVLAGQMIPYLRYSMEDFLSGARHSPKKMKKKMDKLVKKYGDKGVEAVIQYYGSQK